MREFRVVVHVPEGHVLVGDDPFWSLEEFLTERLEEYGVYLVAFEEG